MKLLEEIQIARKHIVTDGYEMSIGELISLYKEKEIIINPDFQRYFRWDISQKTKFIESLLLGIPIPPIFVFQNDDGKWELVDGLQRLSTIYEFVGVLKDSNGKKMKPTVLEGTKLLSDLSGRTWDNLDNNNSSISSTLQLDIKRARIRVEILNRQSDPLAKFELFQRLNTGGSILTPQEVRNCTLVMVNKSMFDWLQHLSSFDLFRKTTNQTNEAISKQKNLELVARFLVYRLVPYKSGLDVNEYLDDGLLQIATSTDLDLQKEEQIFYDTFTFIHSSLKKDAFKRWDGNKFTGAFLLSSFEVIAIGISNNIEALRELENDARDSIIFEKSKNLWTDEEYRNYSKAGVRGTTRIAKLLELAEGYFGNE